MTNSNGPDFSKHHIAVCTPAYGGQVAINYTQSMFYLIDQAAKHGLSLNLNMLSSSVVTDVRNHLAAGALADKRTTHVLWIDADVGFTWAGVRRLLLADLPMVGGIYPKKCYPLDYPFDPLPTGFKPDANGFAEVQRLPGGFLLVKRSVFEALAPTLSNYKCNIEFRDRNGNCRPAMDRQTSFYDTSYDLEHGQLISEDYMFCDRWRAIGGRIFADVTLSLTHFGGHLFQGSPQSLAEYAASRR